MTFFVSRASFLSNFNYAKDSVLHGFESNLEEFKENLNQDLLKLTKRFHENCAILNPDKCCYMSLGKYLLGYLLQYCEEDNKASKLEAVLVIETENKLGFKNHIKALIRLCNIKIEAFDTLHFSSHY